MYGGIAFFSLVLFLPVAPFADRLHSGLSGLAAIVLVLTLATALLSFPFTQERPFKLFFQQTVQLETGGGVRALTELTGLPGYVDRHFVQQLPSAWDAPMNCSIPNSARPSLMTCRWEGGLLPLPKHHATGAAVSDLTLGRGIGDEWLSLATERIGSSRARIALAGTNSRGCRLYFDHAVHDFSVRGTDGAFLAGYEIPPDGVRELRLFSRTWGNEFVVEVGWAGADEGVLDAGLTGRAACEWAEFASGVTGGPADDDVDTGRIPALEELIQFLPLWAQPTKTADGLVEAWTSFAV